MQEGFTSKEEEIRDSLETCRDITQYYRRDNTEYHRMLNQGMSQSNSGQNYYSTMGKREHTHEIPLSRLMDTELSDSARKIVVSGIVKYCLYVFLAFWIARILGSFVIQSTQVEGISMQPALENEEHLLIDKISYRFTQPERYDIVVFPFEKDVYYIKRVIGLPGETVQIIDGAVYINGSLLESDCYGKEIMQRAGRAETEITLGEDEYFVLGDNRNNSLDSRYEIVGNINRSEILGKAILRVAPINRFGTLNK